MRFSSGWACVAAVLVMTHTIPAQGEWVTDSNRLWKVVDGALVEAGKLTFQDSFDAGPQLSKDWKRDGAHTWRVEGGVASNTGYGGGAELVHDLGEGFVVEVKVRPLAEEPDKGGGFTGIACGGILFTLQPGRWWWQYRKPGDTASTGSWKSEPVPFNTTYQFKIVREPGGAYSWYVDGRLIVNLVEPAVKGGLVLRGWRVKAAYDDVRVFAMDERKTATDSTPALNLIRNGSFEQFNDAIPPFWAPTKFREIPMLFGSLEAFRESWTIDESVRYDGVASMRLMTNGLQSYYCNLRTGAPCVLSAWLKADADETPVQMAIWPGTSAVVKVGRVWSRHELPLVNPAQSRVRAQIVSKGPGRVWVDAVQLEEGTGATAYKGSPLDAGGGKSLAEEPIPEFLIRRTRRPPVLDGRLDDHAWNRRTRLPGPKIPTAFPGRYLDPADRTEVFLCHDEATLYAAFRCHVSDMGTNPPAADDEVELFLDPRLGRTTYDWFRVNAAGVKRQSRKLDNSWKAEWTAAVARQADGWTAELAIPLASLGLDPLTADRWGINLARSNSRKGEHACVAPVINRGMYFHNVARYPVCAWQDPSVLEPFRRKAATDPAAPPAAASGRAPRFVPVDGKPAFVFAPLQLFHVPGAAPYGQYDKTIETMLDYWATNGFTTLIVGANIDAEKGVHGERIWEKVLSYADAKGMKIITFFTGPWHSVVVRDHARLESLVNRLKGHPSLLAWQVADEPELYPCKPEEVAEAVALVKRWDPDHPVYVNYTQMGPASRYGGLPGDILSLDYYLSSVEGRTIPETLQYVDQMNEAAAPRGMAVWNFIIGSFPEHHCREISAEEQTAQVYGNAIKGVSGLTFFIGQPMGIRHWARLKQLNSEMQALAPVLFSAEPAGVVSVSDPAVLATLRMKEGQLTLIAVNIGDKAVEAAFDLSGAAGPVAGKAAVRFEGREARVVDGVLKDRFEPFERHVYAFSQESK